MTRVAQKTVLCPCPEGRERESRNSEACSSRLLAAQIWGRANCQTKARMIALVEEALGADAAIFARSSCADVRAS
jgi:hypothetical protein